MVFNREAFEELFEDFDIGIEVDVGDADDTSACRLSESNLSGHLDRCHVIPEVTICHREFVDILALRYSGPSGAVELFPGVYGQRLTL
jgi:hypothetical protein